MDSRRVESAKSQRFDKFETKLRHWSRPKQDTSGSMELRDLVRFIGLRGSAITNFHESAAVEERSFLERFALIVDQQWG